MERWAGNGGPYPAPTRPPRQGRTRRRQARHTEITIASSSCAHCTVRFGHTRFEAYFFVRMAFEVLKIWGMSVPRQLLTPREASRMLGISYPTIKHWILAGKLKTIRTPGGHHRLSAAS